MAFDFKKYKGIPKISTVVVFIAFFMPFFLIKCNGTTLASIPGTTLCVGTEVEGKGSGASATESEIITPKVFAVVGFLAAIAGGIFAVKG